MHHEIWTWFSQFQRRAFSIVLRVYMPYATLTNSSLTTKENLHSAHAVSKIRYRIIHCSVVQTQCSMPTFSMLEVYYKMSDWWCRITFYDNFSVLWRIIGRDRDCFIGITLRHCKSSTTSQVRSIITHCTHCVNCEAAVIPSYPQQVANQLLKIAGKVHLQRIPLSPHVFV